ncbi:alpha-amylase [Lactobacillus selangorensis]|uniref:Alpha-amylase n=1 Tax=Lactobacillus selangorensis TaxID=81857 RepID=A0A0R2G7W4_9LACO|nr:alpha-amylase family glycosyl hydrolase [Lactobacillus selangorensis]KRN28857.1 alpha-amylase [Lactobacillus selangorensis]KRN32733.1 alpha-amylase [Lactobacillus selangorensis]
MVRDTNIDLRHDLVYCVYVRDHTPEGTLKAVEADLPRIKALGTDILWLLPVQPVGHKNRKGTEGSPYAISDYRAINPEFGTLNDFIDLTDKAHQLGMKVMMDIVYNHTSPDSVLLNEHPEWFLHKDGQLANKVADWSDVADLDYSNHDLWQYQIDTLKHWAKWVDGFRCDVAPLVPIDFWMEARKQVNADKPIFWLAESAGSDFIKFLRNQGDWASNDAELYNAFDMTYDYDILGDIYSYIDGRTNLQAFVDVLNRQDVIYPANYVKMHFLENHDQKRAHHLLPNVNDLINWTAFLMFEKGAALIYDGQEFGNAHLPSLFEKENIPHDTGIDLTGLIQSLRKVKANDLVVNGNYDVYDCGNDIVKMTYTQHENQLVGLFSLRSQTGRVKVSLADGDYTNLIDGAAVTVMNGIVRQDGLPIILAK